jgi:hypothetical protein
MLTLKAIFLISCFLPYKDIEHKRKAPLSGKELQELYNDTNKFVFKVEEIISKVRSRK